MPKKTLVINKNDLIDQYEFASESIAKFFCKKHFQGDEHHWIAGDIGGMIEINDHYFNVMDMLQYLKNQYTSKQLFHYYEEALKAHEKRYFIPTIENYKKLKLFKNK